METMTNSEKKEKLYELIKDIKYAMMVSHDGKGLNSRPMAVAMSGDTFENDNIHFVTVRDSKKIDEIIENNEVNVIFSDTSSNNYASVLGRASFTTDKKQIKDHWDFVNNAFFEKGIDTEGLCLIKVHIDHAEYWKVDSNPFKVAFELGKAMAFNDKANITDHQSLKAQ